jgi:hypothetical protein
MLVPLADPKSMAGFGGFAERLISVMILPDTISLLQSPLACTAFSDRPEKVLPLMLT